MYKVTEQVSLRFGTKIHPALVPAPSGFTSFAVFRNTAVNKINKISAFVDILVGECGRTNESQCRCFIKW